MLLCFMFSDGALVTRPESPTRPVLSPKSFKVHTYKSSVSNSFKMNTYEKQGGGGTPHFSSQGPLFFAPLRYLLPRLRDVLYPLPAVALAQAGLCFHIDTNPFFRNSFLLIFMQIGGGGAGVSLISISQERQSPDWRWEGRHSGEWRSQELLHAGEPNERSR